MAALLAAGATTSAADPATSSAPSPASSAACFAAAFAALTFSACSAIILLAARPLFVPARAEVATLNVEPVLILSASSNAASIFCHLTYFSSS